MSEKVDITKAEASQSVEATRIRTSELGNPYLKATGSWIQNEMRRDLAAPNNLITYERMLQDATVSAAVGTASAFLTKALAKAKFVTQSKNPEAIQFCDFMNWNLKNLKDTTWYESSINILSYLQYGWSWLEKVYEPNYSSKHSKYKWKLKKLAPRSQHSIAEWKYSDDNRTVVGLRQYPPQSLNNGYINTTSQRIYEWNDTPIPRNKFMLFSWDAKNSSPTGTSPLNACYKAWKEKVLIEALEVTGISKGLNGVVVLRVPSEHINKAAEDPESNEAMTLNALQAQAALMHSGDQTYLLLGSDVQGENGNGKYVYDFTLQGVDGAATTPVSTAEIINERKKAILDVFGAGFINLGNEANGSYSLADAKTSLHAFFMEKHMIFIQSVIQNDLVKQMMEINRVNLQEDDIPQFQLNALDEVDPEVYSKMIQRVASVGFLPRHKGFILEVLTKCGVDISMLEDLEEDDLLQRLVNPNDTSRGGESQGSSGTGNTQSGGIGSGLNSNNKA